MTDYILLKSQMNEVLAILLSSGIEPSEFRWERLPSKKTPRLYVSSLIHAPTGYYFIFDFKNEKHFCEYSPAEDRRIRQDYPGNWGLQKNYFTLWVNNLTREITAPNLWETLASETELAKSIRPSRNDNSPFDDRELITVKANVKELHEYIKAIQPINETQREIIEERMTYLEEASQRLGRRDWIGLTIGTLVNIVVAAAFAPERTAEIFRFAGRIFRWLIHQAPALR